MICILSMTLPPPTSTLFPYPTLFRSVELLAAVRRGERAQPLVLRSASLGRTIRVNAARIAARSEEHTSELQSHVNLVCRLLLEKKKCRGWTGCCYAKASEVGVRRVLG